MTRRGSVTQAPPEKVLSHWYKLVENFETSSFNFYASVENAVKLRQISEIEISHVDYKEGGLASARREYLRVERGKHVFDVCAAPFGTGFFFSTWLSEKPALTGLQKLGIMAGLFFVL